jgi:hypothetical protein
MMRMILISALAFIIPFVVWYAVARARGHTGGAPIALLSLAGAACVMVTVTALALMAAGEAERAPHYAPPRIERDRTPAGHLGPRGDSPGDFRTPNDPGPGNPDLEPAPEPEPEPVPEPSPAPDR